MGTNKVVVVDSIVWRTNNGCKILGCEDMLISNGQQSIKSNILAQCKASNYLQMT